MKWISKLAWVGLICLFMSSVSVFAEDRDPDSEDADESTETVYVATPLRFGLDLHYVPAKFPAYDWTGGSTSAEMGNGFHLAFSYIPFGTRIGKLGFGFGTGFSAIRNVDFGGTNATVTAVPIEIFSDYHFDYWHNQILVPFVKVGGEYILIKQTGIDQPWRNYTGFTYGAGIQFNLNVLDSSAARMMDTTFGINNTYLTVEYLKSNATSSGKQPDLSREEWRIGLRFEI